MSDQWKWIYCLTDPDGATIRVDVGLSDESRDVGIELENWETLLTTTLSPAEARKMAFAILDATGGREDEQSL